MPKFLLTFVLNILICYTLQLEKEIKELMQQRDLAESRLEDLLRVVGDERASRRWVYVVCSFDSIYCMYIPKCFPLFE